MQSTRPWQSAVVEHPPGGCGGGGGDGGDGGGGFGARPGGKAGGDGHSHTSTHDNLSAKEMMARTITAMLPRLARLNSGRPVAARPKISAPIWI